MIQPTVYASVLEWVSAGVRNNHALGAVAMRAAVTGPVNMCTLGFAREAGAAYVLKRIFGAGGAGLYVGCIGMGGERGWWVPVFVFSF